MGRKKRLKRNIKSWWIGYIDFSRYNKIDTYQYIKSTYKKDIASSLITKENIELIKKLIPEYRKYESITFKLQRIIFERKIKEKGFEDSYLFRIYCNGFTSGFKKIDKAIKSENIAPSIENLQKHIKLQIEDLDDINDYLLADNKRKFDYIDFLVDIGMREGAIFRGILYEKENSNDNLDKSTNFRDYLKIPEELKDELIIRINDYFAVPRKGKDVAIFMKAMWINKYLLKLEKKEPLYKAIEKEVGYTFGEDRSAINKVLNPNNNYNIDDEATSLAERLKI